jgi:hypothetical protein
MAIGEYGPEEFFDYFSDCDVLIHDPSGSYTGPTEVAIEDIYQAFKDRLIKEGVWQLKKTE